MWAKSVKDPVQKEDCISEHGSWCCPLASRHTQASRQSAIGCLTFIMVFSYIVLFSYWFHNLPLCALDKVYPGSVCISANICIGFSATHPLKFPQKHPLWMKGGCSKIYRNCIPKNNHRTLDMEADLQKYYKFSSQPLQ